MACNTCTPTLLVPCCTESLVLGTIENLTQLIYIYVKNLSSGYTYRQESASNGAGLVTLDCSEIKDMLQPNIDFEVWVTKNNEKIRLPITIGAEPYTCFNIEFEKTYDEDGLSTSEETYTLEV